MADSDDEPETEYEPESFEIGGLSMEITTVAFLPIEVLMGNREKDKEISGQKLWCGSLGVIQYILNFPEKVTGRLVVELGAGTGVLGMICKKLGASDVLLTDHDIISINHMNKDIHHNQLDVQVKQLDWYRPSFDGWEVDASPGTVIVAGDVLYKKILIEPFFETTKLLFSRYSESVTMILCHIPRAGVEQQLIVDAATAHGFVVTTVSRDMWATGDCFKYCEADDLSRATLYLINSS